MKTAFFQARALGASSLLALLCAFAAHPSAELASQSPSVFDHERFERTLHDRAEELDRPGAPPSLTSARAYLEAVNDYARALEAALAVADVDERPALHSKLELVLQEGLRRAEAVATSNAGAEDLARFALARAELLLHLGRTSAEPAPFLERARAACEALAREHAPTSAAGFQARLLSSRIERAAASPREAAVWAAQVADAAVPQDLELPAWRELPAEVRAQRFGLLELALVELVPALLDAGDAAGARTWSLRFLAAWKRERFVPSLAGHVALLAVARALAAAPDPVPGSLAGSLARGDLAWRDGEESSGLAFALALADQIVHANRGNALEREARILLGELIERPGAPRSAELLLEAAEGRLALGDPLGAARAFRAAARAPTADAELRARIALGFHGATTVAGPDDPDAAALLAEAEDAVLTAAPDSASADAIHWARAERARAAGDRAGARAHYLALAQTAERHAPARVQAALCLLPEDPAGARAELVQALERLEAAGDPADPAREAASAAARLALGRLAGGADDHDSVLRWLADWVERFPAREEDAPEVLSLLVTARLARGDLEGARADFARLHERSAANPWTARAALELYRSLDAAEGAAAESGARERAAALRRERARCLSVLNAAPDASFANLALEAKLWLALLEWDSAERALRAALALHGTDPGLRAQLDGFVRPELGSVLLELDRAGEAFEVLDPLLPEDGAVRPPPSLVRRWCRSVTGWIDEEGVERRGVGGAENLARAVSLLEQLARLEESAGALAENCEWLELQLEIAHALRQAGRTDPGAHALAARRIDELRAVLAGPAGTAPAEPCTDALRRRLRWYSEHAR